MHKSGVSVMVPTYRRPERLRSCLKALLSQTQPLAELLVVVRGSDLETQALLAEEEFGHAIINVITVQGGGVIEAMNAGLAVASGVIIALTDDDAVPHPDWIARMLDHFAADARVGGVGGRDWQPQDRRNLPDVGRVQWFGRVVGNHHVGCGPAREVDVLKGANCAYRAEPLRRIGFDRRLAGEGAQVHWELGVGLAMRREGWKLIYDPAVAVDHFPARRFDADNTTRGGFNAGAQRNAVYNETLLLLSYLPAARKLAFFVWAVLVGDSGSPGLLQYVRLLPRGPATAAVRLRATLVGRAMALRTYRRSILGKQHGD